MIAYILNIIDLALTMKILESGGAELNPAVNFLLQVHPALYPALKIFGAWLPCFWLELKARENPAASKGLAGITVFYAAVCLWNLIGIVTIAKK